MEQNCSPKCATTRLRFIRRCSFSDLARQRAFNVATQPSERLDYSVAATARQCGSFQTAWLFSRTGAQPRRTHRQFRRHAADKQGVPLALPDVRFVETYDDTIRALRRHRAADRICAGAIRLPP